MIILLVARFHTHYHGQHLEYTSYVSERSRRFIGFVISSKFPQNTVTVMLLLLYFLARRSMSKRLASQKRTDMHTGISSDAFVATEILGKTDRQIQVCIEKICSRLAW